MTIQPHTEFKLTDALGTPRALPALDAAAQANVMRELAALSAQKNAAVETLIRTPEGEASYGKEVRIAGVSGSQRAIAMLADLFAAPTAERGRTI